MAMTLIVFNRTRSTVNLGGRFGHVPPDKERSITLTVADVEYLRPTLVKLKAAGNIEWNVVNAPNTPEDDDAEFVTLEDLQSFTSRIDGWTATFLYETGTVVFQDGTLWRRDTTGSSGTSFDLDEQALWTPLTPAPLPTNLYVDATTGNDANSGSLASPLQSLGEVIRRVNRSSGPLPGNRCVVTFAAGMYVWSETLGPVRFRDLIAFVGEGIIVTAPSAFAQGGTTSVQIVSTGGLTINEYQGLFIEILDGPAAGDIRQVRDNGTSVITPTAAFSAAPVAGNSYRIIEPLVEFQVPSYNFGDVASPLIQGYGVPQVNAFRVESLFPKTPILPPLLISNVRFTTDGTNFISMRTFRPQSTSNQLSN